MKKIDLWTMPNLLIIHLKRFKFTRQRRCKIRTFIEFPLKGLNFENLTRGEVLYVLNKFNSKMVYLHMICTVS
jgi:hypothetical protein